MATKSLVSSETAGKSASVPLRAHRVRLTCDTDYPTGGYPVDFPAAIGTSLGTGNKPLAIVPEGSSDPAYSAKYDRAANKVVIDLERQATPAEASSGDNALDGVTFDFLVIFD